MKVTFLKISHWGYDYTQVMSYSLFVKKHLIVLNTHTVLCDTLYSEYRRALYCTPGIITIVSRVRYLGVKVYTVLRSPHIFKVAQERFTYRPIRLVTMVYSLHDLYDFSYFVSQYTLSLCSYICNAGYFEICKFQNNKLAACWIDLYKN